MMKDALALTSMVGGWYAVWCATPAKASPADWLDAQGPWSVTIAILLGYVAVIGIGVLFGHISRKMNDIGNLPDGFDNRTPEQRARDGGM